MMIHHDRGKFTFLALTSPRVILLVITMHLDQLLHLNELGIGLSRQWSVKELCLVHSSSPIVYR